MSRALGTAFLSHQVAQLEKDVLKAGPTYNRRGGSLQPTRGGGGRGGGATRGGAAAAARRGGGSPERTPMAIMRRNNISRALAPQLADKIVVDASVLIYALSHVRNWCREDRKEVIIIPLEGESIRSSPALLSLRLNFYFELSSQYSGPVQKGDVAYRHPSPSCLPFTRSSSRDQPPNSRPTGPRIRSLGANLLIFQWSGREPPINR